MKVSKKRLLQTLFWLFFLALCFSLGYWQGRKRSDPALFSYQDTLHILTDEPKLLPESFINQFKKLTGFTIQVFHWSSASAEIDFDIYIGHKITLEKSLKKELLSAPLNHKIFIDFQKIQPTPILWRVLNLCPYEQKDTKNKKLVIKNIENENTFLDLIVIGINETSDNKNKYRNIKLFFEKLVSEKIIELWANESEYNTTLDENEKKHLVDENKKPENIRSYPLTKFKDISIEEYNSILNKCQKIIK